MQICSLCVRALKSPGHHFQRKTCFFFAKRKAESAPFGPVKIHHVSLCFKKTLRLDLTLEQTRYLQDRGGKPKMLSSTKLSILGRAATQVFTIEVLIQSASTNW